MFLVESDANTVLPGLLDNVRHITRSILPILEVNLSLGRSLNGDGEGPRTSLSGPHVELGRLSLHASFKTWSTCMYSVRPRVLKRSHSELERRSRDVHLAVSHGHRVDSQFLGHKVDRIETLFKLGDIGDGGTARGAGHHGVQVLDADAGHLER